MAIRDTFKRLFLRRMDSESTHNRKVFLKRAGVALAGIFAVSSISRASAASAASTTPQGASQGASQGAMARIRTAKGAVARRA